MQLQPNKSLKGVRIRSLDSLNRRICCANYMRRFGCPLALRYSDAARPNNVVRGVDFGERRAAPYNPSLERTRLHRYALLGIAILRMAQPREGVAHLALR